MLCISGIGGGQASNPEVPQSQWIVNVIKSSLQDTTKDLLVRQDSQQRSVAPVMWSIERIDCPVFCFVLFFVKIKSFHHNYFILQM